MQAAGAKLVLVDMRGPGGPLVTDLADGRHPNDAGYVKMANIWFGGIQEVTRKGLLTAPLANINSTSTSNSISTNSSNSTTASTASKTTAATMSNNAAALTSAGIRIMTEDTFFATMSISLFVAMYLSY